MNNYSQIISIIRKYEIIIASLLVIFMLTLGSYFFLIPNFNRAKIIFSDKNNIQKSLDKLNQKENALNDLDEKYYQGILVKFKRILPDSVDFITLFETIDNLEKKTNIKLIKADFPLGSLSGGSGKLKKAKKGDAFLLPVTITIQGEYSAIIKFLDSLSDLTDRIFTVDDIVMQMKKPDNYILSLTTNTYVVLPVGSIGSLESPMPKIEKNKQDLLDKISKVKIEMIKPVKEETVPLGKKNLFD